MNLNDIAREVTLQEGKEISLPIGQVKEVMKLMLEELGSESDIEILRLVNKYREADDFYKKKEYKAAFSTEEVEVIVSRKDELD